MDDKLYQGIKAGLFYNGVEKGQPSALLSGKTQHASARLKLAIQYSSTALAWGGGGANTAKPLYKKHPRNQRNVVLIL